MFDAATLSHYYAHGDLHMAKLHLLPEMPDSEPLDLIETVVLIGRKPDNTLQVEDNNVSKYHALLLKTEDGYRLYDLHSSNGTYVNDQRITATILKNNDQLRIGPAVFRFESEPGPAAAPVPVLQPKVRFAGRLSGAPLGRKPGATPTLSKPGTEPTTISQAPPTPAPIPVPSLAPEPAAPRPPSVVTTTATPAQAVPVAETTPAPKPVKKEEPRVSIRIPESKKSLISQSLAPSDAKETQQAQPIAPPAEAERPRPRLGFAPQPPSEPAPAPEPVPEQPVQPFATTLGGPKPAGSARPLRPKLGGAGGGGIKLKSFKK